MTEAINISFTIVNRLINCFSHKEQSIWAIDSIKTLKKYTIFTEKQNQK